MMHQPVDEIEIEIEKGIDIDSLQIITIPELGNVVTLSARSGYLAILTDEMKVLLLPLSDYDRVLN